MATDSQFAALLAIEEAGWDWEYDLDTPSPAAR